MLRINIDGNSFDGAVNGLPELEERIFRSDELKGFLREINGSVVVHGEAYGYVRRVYKDNLYSRMRVQLDEQDVTTGVWTRIFDGEIKTENIRFDLIQREAECEVTDVGFFGIIDANRKVSAKLGVSVSINGQVINPLPVNNFSLFDITNYFNTNNSYAGGPLGVITMPPCQGYYTADVLKFLVEFMSDGQVRFRSDFFDYNNVNNFFAFTGIFSGQQLRLPTFGTAPRLSWDELFSDIHKLFNVWFTIEDDGAGPIMRVEPYTYFISNAPNQYLEAVTLTESLDKSILYNQIDVGCSRQDRGFVPNQPGVYHLRERYTTAIKAKEDIILDLRMQRLIISSNSIKRALNVRLRGGHEITPLALMRGQQESSPISAFLLRDKDTREFTAYSVDQGQLAVNFSTNFAGATGPLTIPPTGINIEQGIFFGNDTFTIFDTDDEYDEEVFFIQFTSTNDARLRVTDAPPVGVGAPNVAAYNPDINNISVVNRHLNSLPGTILIQGALGTLSMDVGLTWAANTNAQYLPTPQILPPGFTPPTASSAYTFSWQQIVFPEDVQAPTENIGGAYSTLNGFFTCPPGGGGIYGFRTMLNVLNTSPNLSTFDPGLFSVAIQHYDVSNTLVKSESQLFQIPFGTAFPCVVDGVFNLQVGDSVVVIVGKGAIDGSGISQTLWKVLDLPQVFGSWPNNDIVRWSNRSFFRLMSQPDALSIIATGDQTRLEAVINDVEGYISEDQWELIRQNPYTGIEIRFGHNKSITARPRELTRNLSDGNTNGTFQRIFDQSNNLLNE